MHQCFACDVCARATIPKCIKSCDNALAPKQTRDRQTQLKTHTTNKLQEKFPHASPPPVCINTQNIKCPAKRKKKKAFSLSRFRSAAAAAHSNVLVFVFCVNQSLERNNITKQLNKLLDGAWCGCVRRN